MSLCLRKLRVNCGLIPRGCLHGSGLSSVAHLKSRAYPCLACSSRLLSTRPSIEQRRCRLASSAMADGSAHESASGSGFISSTSGEFSVRAGPHVREGKYSYNIGTSTILDEAGKAVGRFSCDPIGDPSLFTPDFLSTDATKNLPVIRVIKGEIIEDIQDPDNAGAYFVLPSQLNGAEYPSHGSVVQLLQDYQYDRTGGPRGQLAVHPAAGQFVLDNAACDGREHGISAVDGILSAARECKGACAHEFELVNGYLKMPMPSSQEAADEAFQLFAENLHTLRPLIMREVPACGLLPRMQDFSAETHRVGLVYASAVPVNAYTNRAGSHKPAASLHSRVAEAVLVAQYYGALSQLAAPDPARERTTVYLMPLGGGVFNNSWESIAKSMSIAVEMLDATGKLDGLDIRALTWRGKPEEYKTLTELLGRHKKLAG